VVEGARDSTRHTRFKASSAPTFIVLQRQQHVESGAPSTTVRSLGAPVDAKVTTESSMDAPPGVRPAMVANLTLRTLCASCSLMIFGRIPILTACWLLFAALMSPAPAVDLKAKTFPLTILGVKVDIPVTTSFSVSTAGNELDLQVQAQGDLGDVQQKALAIARAIPMPQGNCDRTGINPVVNSIDSASITPAGTTATITIAGHVTAWLCERPLGQTIKTIVASDSVTLTAPVQIIVDQNQVGLKLAGPVTVAAGHALTEDVVNLFAGDVSASITSQLAKALDASEARASLPSAPGLVANVQNAQFAAAGSELRVIATGTARMSGDTLSSLLEQMSK
jgi:hypothetical protein